MVDSNKRELCFICDNPVVTENSYTILCTTLADGKVLLSESIKKVVNCDSEPVTFTRGILCRRCFLLFDDLELALIRCKKLHETILDYYSIKTKKNEVYKGSDLLTKDLESHEIIGIGKDCVDTGVTLKPVEIIKGKTANKKKDNKVPTSVSCPECGRVFRRICNLRNHMRNHEKYCAKLQYTDTTDMYKNIQSDDTKNMNQSNGNTASYVHNIFKDKSDNDNNEIEFMDCNKPSEELNSVLVEESDDDFTWSVPNIGDESEDNIKENRNDKGEIENKQERKDEIQENDIKDSHEESKELKKPWRRRQTHEDGSMFECDICGKQWQRATQLRIHEATHSNLRPYICEICGQAYKHKHALDIHVGMHQGINPFSCQICGKAFTQKGALQRHLPIHTGEAPYQCEYCGKRFVHHTSFNMHTLAHTGEKTFICKVCGLALLSGSHLKRHSRIHTGERPFACPHCGKRFAEKYNLMAHQRTHGTQDNVLNHRKSHVCKVCGLTFDRKPKLEDHLTVCHNKIVDEPKHHWTSHIYNQDNDGIESAIGEADNLAWN